MIGGEDESSLVAIFRHGLHDFPQLLHEMVEAVGALQHQIVAALVCPVIGFAISHEEHARMICLHIIQQRYL